MTSQRTNPSNFKSLSTMGYLTMIITLAPGIAAFSTLERPLVKPGSTNGSGRSTVYTYNLRTDGTTDRNHEGGVATQLYYISETSRDVPQQGHGQSWWNSVFARDQRSAADEYLEFLDRRYNRLLNDDEKKQQQGTFSVLNWLNQGANGDAIATTPKNPEEDALFVLGVAGLASKKLLQKHQLLQQSGQSNGQPATRSKVMDATDAEIVDESDVSTPLAVRSATTLFRQVGRRRDVFVRSQSKHVRLALVFMIRTLATGPVKVARNLYNMGGGKKSLALTFAALAALSYLLRPLLQVAANEVGLRA